MAEICRLDSPLAIVLGVTGGTPARAWATLILALVLKRRTWH